MYAETMILFDSDDFLTQYKNIDNNVMLSCQIVWNLFKCPKLLQFSDVLYFGYKEFN